MRYTLFGLGEGVRIDEGPRLWASVERGRVSDASAAARKQGLRPGTPTATAKALVPGLALYEEPASPSRMMEQVWSTLWGYTPWLETVGKDSFFIQVPGSVPPLQEIREIMQQLDTNLPEGSRFCMGLAETPKLARALVQWAASRRREMPRISRTMGRQRLWISPGLTGRRKISSERDGIRHADSGDRPAAVHPPAAAPGWILALPVDAVWFLSSDVQAKLKEFGVFRLADLVALPDADIMRWFGRESLLWKQAFAEVPPGQIQVNYPPAIYSEEWESRVGETMPAEYIPKLVEALMAAVVDRLQKAGRTALRAGMVWKSTSSEGRFAQAAGRPLHRLSSWLAHLQEGVRRCREEAARAGGIAYVEVYAADLQPLRVRQSRFTVKNGLLIPDRWEAGRKIEHIMTQINGRFPDKLRIGVRGSLRELRWRMVAEA
ncbi:Y-family DNA polymerase [Alicyclobacillus shizuokensis]|uniref:Y-family DNA polymerase n=1 Tax=Alicyclobacillus shizuokensis TaxID=392014 RepID=UPI00082BE51B|nr:hypothetical protein [Alicyclobacillus shizuokensis]